MVELLKIGEIVDGDGNSPNDEAVIYTNDNDDWREITVEGRDALEFAAFIVKAVNNHDALVEALTDLIEAVRRDSDEGGKGISGYTAARLSDARSVLGAVGGPSRG